MNCKVSITENLFDEAIKEAEAIKQKIVRMRARWNINDQLSRRLMEDEYRLDAIKQNAFLCRISNADVLKFRAQKHRACADRIDQLLKDLEMMTWEINDTFFRDEPSLDLHPRPIEAGELLEGGSRASFKVIKGGG